MQIIPNRPLNNNSKAEYRVFDKLFETFSNNPLYVAFHSLNLTSHNKKRVAEADFVILCEYGLFVLEVKGGRVSYSNGRWYTIDRNGEKFRLKESPFLQAKGALYSIYHKIKNSSNFQNLKLPIGFGVVFPDIEWKEEGMEWDNDIICDAKKFRNFEKWLKNFFEYWNLKNKNLLLSKEEIESLKQFLRPEFEIVEFFDEKLLDESNQYKYAKEIYLDILISNNKVLCYGKTGSGKTFLATKLALELAKNKKKVVFICKSKFLKRYIETDIQNEFIYVSTLENIRLDMKRYNIEKFDVLIVDEGEEFFNFDDLKIFDEIINGGLERGDWYIFYDSELKLFNANLEVLKILKSYVHTNLPLNYNFRKSKNNLKIIKKSKVDINFIKNFVEEVEIFELNNCENYVEVLENEINDILNKGFLPKDITILSPFSFEKSSVALLTKKIKILSLDEYSVKSFPLSEITFCEIDNFKGLENKVIILIDMLYLCNKTLYVATSRANKLLYFFTPFY